MFGQRSATIAALSLVVTRAKYATLSFDGWRHPLRRPIYQNRPGVLGRQVGLLYDGARFHIVRDRSVEAPMLLKRIADSSRLRFEMKVTR